MTRVCPLFAMLKSGEVREHDARCLEDKCAWFNRRERYCSINEIADSLSLIVTALENIQTTIKQGR